MVIPTSVKVGAHHYDVDQNYYFTERSDHSGQSNHAQLKIRISPVDVNGNPRPRSVVEGTFIHELLHCVDVVYNAGALEEATVERLAEGLYQVLNDGGMLQ